MEYFSTIRNTATYDNMPDVENIMLSKISQTEKFKNHMIFTYMCNIKLKATN